MLTIILLQIYISFCQNICQNLFYIFLDNLLLYFYHVLNFKFNICND